MLGNLKVIRPGFWIGDPALNTKVADAELQIVADDTRAAVVASGLMAGFDDSVVFQEVEVQNFTRVATEAEPPLPQWTWEAVTTSIESSGADVPGTQTLDALPPQNAFVVSIKSAVPGPSGRNRMYGPPLVDSEVSGSGLIDSARVTQLQADIGTIMSAAKDAPTEPAALVVASAEDNELYVALTATVKNIVRSQRRRTTA